MLAGFFFAGSTLAVNPGDRVDNFRLLDNTGASHELYYFSDAKAVVLMTYGNGERRAIRGQMGELGGYAPGKNAIPYPTDSGILLRREASFRFQMHYTPNGKAITDVTRLGLYFYDKPPKLIG